LREDEHGELERMYLTTVKEGGKQGGREG